MCKSDRCGRIVLSASPSPPQALTTSVLAQVILSLEALPTDLATERQFWAFVGALMNHQVVGLREPALTVLADEFALLAQLTPEVPCVIFVDLHHSEHFVWSMMLATGGACCKYSGATHCDYC
uniref:Uncharacterized protein n=1 Tax=Pectinophora gossypiella TaxID=13191 RepID=A0A1E1WFZ3_PECGO